MNDLFWSDESGFVLKAPLALLFTILTLGSLPSSSVLKNGAVPKSSNGVPTMDSIPSPAVVNPFADTPDC